MPGDEESHLLQPGDDVDPGHKQRRERRAVRNTWWAFGFAVFITALAIARWWYMHITNTVRAVEGKPPIPKPQSESWNPTQVQGGWRERMFTGRSEWRELTDPETDPCTDFYEHACGGFSKHANELPLDHDHWLFAFDGVRERTSHKLVELLELDKGQAGQLYKSCMDKSAIEKAGIAPLKRYLAIADAISTNTSLVHAVAALHNINSKAFFYWTVGADADSTEQVLYLQQGGLTLPDLSYYSNPAMFAKREAMRRFVEKIMGMVGEDAKTAQFAADSVMEIESELARFHLSHADERAANSLPPLSGAQVTKGMSVPGGFDWGTFFHLIGVGGAAGGVDDTTKIVRVIDVDFFSKLCHYLAVNKPDHFRWYIKWKFLDVLIGHLGKTFQEADLNFRKELFGVQKDPPRWRMCLHTLNIFVPDTVGELYNSKTQKGAESEAADMLTKLRDSFSGIIKDSDWMSSQAQGTALKKLMDMKMEVGGPKKIPALPFKCDDDWFSVSISIAKHLVEHQIEKIGTVIGRSDWGTQLGATSVNAFYNVHSNALFVPSALLQAPFFKEGSSEGQSRVSNWGSLGGLLGHEMSHGFDNVGRLFGPDQVIRSWWDASTVKEYTQRAQCIGDYYNGFVVEGKPIHGNSTLEEDIADQAGLHIAYEAMRSQLKSGAATDAVHGTEASKRFFISWAQTWCSLATHKEKQYVVMTDPHAPSRVRVNAAMSSFPGFADTYRCPAGTAMNVHHGRGCSLW